MKGIIATFFVYALLTGCAAIPKGGIVFSGDHLDGCGLFDISEPHNGSYLRVTTELPKSLTMGGAPKHNHGIEHGHSGDTWSTDAMNPMGLTNEAAAKNHKHAVETTAVTAISVSTETVDFDHIRVGLHQRVESGHCAPSGTIIGYVGEEIPEGWEAIGDGHVTYLRVAATNRGTETQLGNSHDHEVAHAHEAIIGASDGRQLQFYEPGHTGAALSDRSHVHNGVKVALAEVESGDARPDLPSLAMRLIRSKDPVGTLPRGAVIGFAGKRLPGLLSSFPRTWRTALPLDGQSSDGLFVAADRSAVSAAIRKKDISHQHSLAHEHTVISGESLEAAGKARAGRGQYVSVLKHLHKQNIGNDSETEMNEHLPPYTNLMLLIRE